MLERDIWKRGWHESFDALDTTEKTMANLELEDRWYPKTVNQEENQEEDKIRNFVFLIHGRNVMSA